MTKLEILNNALLKCGISPAANLDDMDLNALAVYEACAEEALSAWHWTFARGYAPLVEVTDGIAYGGRHAYELPSDYLAFIEATQSPDSRAPKAREVDRVGRRLYCNVSPCFLRYTRRLLEPAEWPATFAYAVSALIAHRIASLSAEKIQLAQALYQYYLNSVAIAQAQDARETRTQMPKGSGLAAVRKSSE